MCPFISSYGTAAAQLTGSCSYSRSSGANANLWFKTNHLPWEDVTETQTFLEAWRWRTWPQAWNPTAKQFCNHSFQCIYCTVIQIHSPASYALYLSSHIMKSAVPVRQLCQRRIHLLPVASNQARNVVCVDMKIVNIFRRVGPSHPRPPGGGGAEPLYKNTSKLTVNRLDRRASCSFLWPLQL